MKIFMLAISTLNSHSVDRFKRQAGGYMGCVSGWTQFTLGDTDICLKYIGKFPASEGFPKCQELNADLPLPKSEEENKNWRDGFDAVGATDGVLLDANDLENEGDFRDSYNNTLQYANWYWREPNNLANFEECCGGEDYVQMNNPFFPETETAHLGWNDIPSIFGSQVVCWRELEFIPTPAPVTTSQATSTTASTAGSTAATTSAATTSSTAKTTVATTTESTTLSTTTSKPISSKIRNIVEMAVARLSKPFEWDNYGCAGRGRYNPFEKTLGLRKDETDRAFFLWKSCYNCATGGDANNVFDYDYNLSQDSCGASTKKSRALCECDRQLTQFLLGATPNSKFVNLSQSKCEHGSNQVNLECCKYNRHLWRSYNIDTQSCCTDGVRPIGTC